MRRSARVAQAFLDRIASGDVLTLRCKDKNGECEVFLDVMEGTSSTGIVGVRGASLKNFPSKGSSMSDVFRWVRSGRGRSICHPVRGWIEKPDLNDFYYLQLGS